MPRVPGFHVLALCISVSLAPSLARATDFSAGDLAIQHPWMRATPNGAQVAGGYLTIVNHGTAADTLTGGTLNGAGLAEVHTMTMEDGVMRMRPSGPVLIPPGGSVTLTPSGMHIMFTQLSRTFAKGDIVAGSLIFRAAGNVPIRFTVEGIGAKAPSEGDAHAMPAMKMD